MPTRNKILITGSSGMLGIDLCRELSRDYTLAGADLVRNRLSEVRSFYQCDITDEKAVFDIITKAKPDVVIHTAAWTDVDGCEQDRKKAYKANSEGTRNVALACKSINAALIYISTDFVFDGKKKAPYKESDKPGPLSVYGDSKLKGERYVLGMLKEHFILRTSWLYGRNGKNFVDTIVSKARTAEILKVVNDQIGSPTYSKDLAEAIHALLHKASAGYGIYHVSNSGSVSWYEYAKTILSIAGEKARVVPISSKELNRPAERPEMSVMDNSKFIKFIGYRMRSWQDALKDYLDIKIKGEVSC